MQAFDPYKSGYSCSAVHINANISLELQTVYCAPQPLRRHLTAAFEVFLRHRIDASNLQLDIIQSPWNSLDRRRMLQLARSSMPALCTRLEFPMFRCNNHVFKQSYTHACCLSCSFHRVCSNSNIRARFNQLDSSLSAGGRFEPREAADRLADDARRSPRCIQPERSRYTRSASHTLDIWHRSTVKSPARVQQVLQSLKAVEQHLRVTGLGALPLLALPTESLDLEALAATRSAESQQAFNQRLRSKEAAEIVSGVLKVL